MHFFLDNIFYISIMTMSAKNNYTFTNDFVPFICVFDTPGVTDTIQDVAFTVDVNIPNCPFV